MNAAEEVFYHQVVEPEMGQAIKAALQRFVGKTVTDARLKRMNWLGLRVARQVARKHKLTAELFCEVTVEPNYVHIQFGRAGIDARGRPTKH